jgi:hypothetical protein
VESGKLKVKKVKDKATFHFSFVAFHFFFVLLHPNFEHII